MPGDKSEYSSNQNSQARQAVRWQKRAHKVRRRTQHQLFRSHQNSPPSRQSTGPVVAVLLWQRIAFITRILHPLLPAAQASPGQ